MLRLLFYCICCSTYEKYYIDHIYLVACFWVSDFNLFNVVSML